MNKRVQQRLNSTWLVAEPERPLSYRTAVHAGIAAIRVAYIAAVVAAAAA